MSDTRWLTYDELAEALGIAPDSARRLVARKKWPRKPNNEGRALVAVPAEYLDNRPDAGPDTGEDAKEDDIPDAAPDITHGVRILSEHIERLERELEAVKGERDTERASAARLAQQAARVDVLEMLIEVERKRVEEARATASAVTDKAGRVDVLEAQLEAERKRADEWKAVAEAPRGWWPWRRRA